MRAAALSRMARRTPAKPSHDRAPRADDDVRDHASRGAARSTWSGSISFGLLQIPVSLIPAESRSDELHFRLLDRRDLAPIRYERVNASTGEPVEWKDIVKGYEIEKDRYVVVEPEDLAKANVSATQTIDIQDFVPRDQIEPAFFETPYFVVPQPRSTKAYALLRDALNERDAVAIATFVLRTREHLVAILPGNDGALRLEVLRFGHQLKDVADVPLPALSDAIAPNARELAMADQLIGGMMSDWEPRKYKDRYHRDVMKVIEEKARTGATTEHNAGVAGTVARDDAVDLLALLEQSVAKAGRAANEARPGPKKAGPGGARRAAKKRRAA